MKEQKEENNLIKENERMSSQLMELSDELFEQVYGGQTIEVILDLDEYRPHYIGQQKQIAAGGRVDKFKEKYDDKPQS